MNFLQRLRTFPRGLWWVGFFSFFGTCVLGALVLLRTGAWCNALEHYRITTIRELLFGLVMTVVYAPLVLWLGVKGYRHFRSRWPSLRSISGTSGYCGALACAVFPLQFLRIPINLRNHSLELSICAKSTSDGMFTNSTGLTAAEYEHLRKMLPLLPDPPIRPDSINLFYYSDGFLPDFGLKVRCAVPRTSAIGIAPIGLPPFIPSNQDGPSGWMIDTAGADPKIAWLVFEDGES